MTAFLEHRSLSDVCREILTNSTPRTGRRALERRVREMVAYKQRWRRRSDGLVVRIEAIHRADRLVEVQADATSAPGSAWERSRYMVSFGQLAADYELLLSLVRS